MTPDTLPKRVFFCLLIIVIFFGAMGCSTTKYEWLPEDRTPLTTDEKETGVVKGTIVKASF